MYLVCQQDRWLHWRHGDLLPELRVRDGDGDEHDPEQRGGTGQTIDWTAAARVAGERRVLLAGGLTPDNAAEAVGRVRPFGIDVSSGVEAKPGVKDHGKLRDLFHAINDHTPRP